MSQSSMWAIHDCLLGKWVNGEFLTDTPVDCGYSSKATAEERALEYEEKTGHLTEVLPV